MADPRPQAPSDAEGADLVLYDGVCGLSFYVFANYRTSNARVFTRSAAALFVASELGWPWKAMGAAAVLPKAFLDCVYDVVARTRYRVFRRYEQCLTPRPEFTSRFLD
jgi:predicted DCC family thiol-disulfide oxidoreductase YuxK